MTSLQKMILAAALAAIAVLGAGPVSAAPMASPGSATIANPGGRDYSGFLIVVEASGKAWSLDGAGHSSGTLPLALAQALFTDLAAAGPLAQLPERNCDDALVIGWNGQRSSNLRCSTDARAAKLLADVAAIQNVLYVRSYRTTAPLQVGSAGSAAYSSAGYNSASVVSSAPAPSNPTYANYSASQTSSQPAAGAYQAGPIAVNLGASTSVATGAGLSTIFTGVTFGQGNGTFANSFMTGKFSSEGSFSNGHFSNTGAQVNGRFSENEKFSGNTSNPSFHSDLSLHESGQFNSGNSFGGGFGSGSCSCSSSHY